MRGRDLLPVALLALLALLLSAGCVGTCPQSCDDSNPCTRDHCDAGTMFACGHEPLDGGRPACDAIVPPCRAQTCEAGSCVLSNISQCCGNGACEANEDIANCPADCSASVKLECDASSPLVPILLKMEKDLGAESIVCTATNNGAAEMDVIFTAEVPGWSENYTSSLPLQPGAPRKIPVELAWKGRFYENKETADAAITFRLESQGLLLASQTTNIQISPKEDVYWRAQYGGQDVPLERSLVAWVTPHDTCVGSLISSAKELAPGRSLGGYAGYEGLSEEERSNRTLAQARAVFYAVKGQGVSYVNTPLSLRGSQRVKMPADSLAEKSGNCVDGTVLFASAFEALGMNPVFVMMPQHMFVGVETFPGSNRYVFIETTMAGSGSFEDAVNEGSDEFETYKASGNVSVIDVAANRQNITPFPSSTACAMNITCPDGTLQGHCSQGRPKLCVGTGFVDAASVCGCDTGYVAAGDKCYSLVVKNETFVLGHGGTRAKYYFWGPNYDAKSYHSFRYIVRSSQPLLVLVFPSRSDYELFRDGMSYNYYPSYSAENALDYDQTVMHEGSGGIGLLNMGKSDAVVNVLVMELE